MSDETKVPPGWVRLTGRTSVLSLVAPASDWRYRISGDGAVRAWIASDPDGIIDLRESPAEVAALIAAAQAAERRAAAMPVMAAVLWASKRAYPAIGRAVHDAAAILDAIERREGEWE